MRFAIRIVNRALATRGVHGLLKRVLHKLSAAARGAGQLRVVARLLDYFSNFSRFHSNRRSQPSRRVRPGCGRALVCAWWQWALQGVGLELTRRRSRRLTLSWQQLLQHKGHRV